MGTAEKYYVYWGHSNPQSPMLHVLFYVCTAHGAGLWALGDWVAHTRFVF